MNDDARTRLLRCICRYAYREGDFLLASGKRSTFYIDMRSAALTGEGAALIGELITQCVRDRFPTAAAIGGMTLGADPLTTAAAIHASQDGGSPLAAFIVRKESKGHGAAGRIVRSGDLQDGADVVVLDDTVTTGGSTCDAVEVMRAHGFRVVGAVCVVDRVQGGEEALRAAGVPFVSLFRIDEIRHAFGTCASA